MPELQDSARWPWILIAVAIAVAVAVSVRICRRGGQHVQATAQQAQATAQPVQTGTQATQESGREQVGNPPGRTATSSDTGGLAVVSATNVLEGIEKVKELAARGKSLAAREEAFLRLSSIEAGSGRTVLEDLLGQIHTNLVFSAAPMPEKTNHVIKANESLEAIAKRYKTTVELLQAGNGISNPARIRKGDLLRPLTGTFRIDVHRSSHELVLYLNDRFFKRYSVGTGKHEKTPVGSFTVVDRIREPVWWHPDGKQIPYGNPDNILGTRWLALKATGDTPDVKGYGIHGTWDDSSVGKSESAGCVRMRNRDVEELFVLVPNGTAVRILDK